MYKDVVGGVREYSRSISVGAGIAEGTLGVATFTTGNPVTALLTAGAETVSTAADVVSFGSSILLMEGEEIKSDGIAILVPAVLNRTVLKKLSEYVEEENLDSQIFKQIEQGAKTVSLTIENLFNYVFDKVSSSETEEDNE